jgi:CBS domain-containing protein
MIVAHILAEKGRDVIAATPETSIAEAAAILAKRRIGALVVLEDGARLTGIVSERDIVRAISAHGAEALEKSVGSIMTRAVMTCGEGDSINELMSLMTEGRFRHLPVVERGRLTGIVSVGDVVKARIGEVEREAEDMRIYIATA